MRCVSPLAGLEDMGFKGVFIGQTTDCIGDVGSNGTAVNVELAYRGVKCWRS